MKTLMRYFASGLMFSLPIAITVIVFSYAYDKLARCLRGPFVFVYKAILIDGKSLYEIMPKHVLALCAEVVTVAVVFVVLAFIGWIVSHTLRQCKDNAIHRLLENVPVIKTIFRPVNQAVQSLLGDDMKGRKVVRFAYPTEPYWGVGIVMGEETFDNEEFCVVMMPLTMSAGTGMLLRIPKSRTKVVDVDATTALEHVITCGMIPLLEKDDVLEDILTDVEQFWRCVRQGQAKIRFRFQCPVKDPERRMSMRKKKIWYCHRMFDPIEGTRQSLSDWLKARIYVSWYYRSQLQKYRCDIETNNEVICFRRGK